MAICLKCGKEITSDRNYCDDCGALGAAQVEKLFGIVAGSDYRARRTYKYRGFIIGLVILFFMLVIVVWVFATLGVPGPDLKKKVQASVCRGNLRMINEATADRVSEKGEHPRTGSLDGDHPLVMERFIEKAPRCPSTEHLYVLVDDGTETVPICDSGLQGHEIN